MTRREKLVTVLRHMFSRKALGYRAFTVSWTMCAVMFWNYIYFDELVFFESLEITLTIVIGKFIFYGVWEFFHLKEVTSEDVFAEEGIDPGEHLILIEDPDGGHHYIDYDDHHDHPPGHS